MKRIAVALAAAMLAAQPVAAQDLAGPVAAAIDQVGQGLGESMTGGPGVFVTAQGRAPMPAAAASRMSMSIKGEGKTAVEAVAARDATLERVRAAARRHGVEIEVGATNFDIAETPDWVATADVTMPDFSGMGEDEAIDAAADAAAATIDAAAMDDAPKMTRTVTASVQVTLQRPAEDRLPAFIDALAEAGVTDLSDSLYGLNLGQWQPFLALLGLDTANDPGEPVWNAATADGIARARAQAQAIADASGRRLGQVRYVSVLMRSHDGRDALVSVAVRFGFE